jgi:hypothetical protein
MPEPSIAVIHIGYVCVKIKRYEIAESVLCDRVRRYNIGLYQREGYHRASLADTDGTTCLIKDLIPRARLLSGRCAVRSHRHA